MTDWEQTAEPLPPRDDEVHVWRVRTDRAAGDLARWEAVLSADELERASHFHLEPHRHRFLMARGVLRALLAGYAGTAPEDLSFRYAEHGKPYLPREVAGGLDFNLAHSGQVVLFAIGWGREVGVDVEHTDRDVGWQQVARRFFAAAEYEALEALPPPQRRAGFFNCWTRKEAYLKARGRGLSVGLGSFSVSLAPAQPAELTWTAEGASTPGEWRLEALEPAPGYTGAVCAQGHDWRLRCLDWAG